jgi:hypothetical protein
MLNEMRLNIVHDFSPRIAGEVHGGNQTLIVK